MRTLQHHLDAPRDTPDDMAQLLAILRAEPEASMSQDDIWRRHYREVQRRIREIGVQHDLFGASPVTRYRRHSPAPEAERPSIETIDEKLLRIEGDPLATFGPERSDRPGFLSSQVKQAIVRNASNWLTVRSRVRLVDAPTPVDPQFGTWKHIGREGVVWRLCGRPFDDHVRIFLDPVGGERTEKIVFVEVRDLEYIPC